MDDWRIPKSVTVKKCINEFTEKLAYNEVDLLQAQIAIDAKVETADEQLFKLREGLVTAEKNIKMIKLILEALEELLASLERKEGTNAVKKAVVN